MKQITAADGWIEAALAPGAIAVVGASDNPEKIGGRPIKYMLRDGYRGRIFPVNPGRDTIQGLPAYASLADLPAVPDLVLVCVPGQAAVQAVQQSAAMGVKLAVVIASGFGEVDEAGKRAQEQMLSAARASGMRLVGPNTQGIVNFGNATVASFATLMGEVEPGSGPVAVISQSGAMSVVPWAFLRAAGIGVKHSHATGNEADLSVADFALACVRDPEVKLVLLYLESVKDPATLAQAAREALQRGVQIVALKAGVSSQGQAAASSHTGAIASEDHVIDAFFRQHGILRVADMRSLVLAARLYLQAWSPAGTRVAAISNSGACCVMAADAAARHGLQMESLPPVVQAELRQVLPAFASTMNPIDLTAALLSDSALFSRVLPIVAKHKAADLFFISLPMSGKGYDVPRFAHDARQFAQVTGAPVVVASPLASTRAQFEQEGVLCFEHDEDAMAALAQFARHQAMRRAALALPSASDAVAALALPASGPGFLSEADSLDLLARLKVPCAPWRLCRSREQAQAAARELGGKLVVKACSASIPHKSEYGLVLLGVQGEQDAGAAYAEIMRRADQAQLPLDAVIVARMVGSRRELIVGARHDPKFGAVVMIGDGGKYVEAMPDVVTLVMPFDVAYAVQRMQDLRIAALFPGVRGEAPMPVEAIARCALALGQLVQAANGAIASVDINPLMIAEDGVLAVDALVEIGETGSAIENA